MDFRIKVKRLENDIDLYNQLWYDLQNKIFLKTKDSFNMDITSDF